MSVQNRVESVYKMLQSTEKVGEDLISHIGNEKTIKKHLIHVNFKYGQGHLLHVTPPSLSFHFVCLCTITNVIMKVKI